MNHRCCRRHRTPWGLLLAPALVALCPAFAARAQVLPRDITEAANADTPQTLQAIQQYVTTQVKKIAGDNPRDQAAGRDFLVNTANQQTASPSFLNAYAQQLNRQLLDAAGNKNLRVRLNAAIANYGVARKAGNGQLVEATRKFMADDAEPVALWGVKAAAFVLPAELRSGAAAANNKNSLANAIIETVERFPDSGPIVEEAYAALTLGVGSNTPAAGVTPAMLRAAAPKVMDLLQRRIDLYQGLLPAYPSAETAATNFLSFQSVWDAMQPAERTRSVQQLDHLISLGGQQAAAAGAEVDPELVKVLQFAGSAMRVLGDRLKDANLQAAGKALADVTPRQTGAEIGKRADALAAAIQANAQFKGIKPAPKFNPAGAEPATPAAPAEGDGNPPGGGAAPAPPATAPGRPAPAPVPGRTTPVRPVTAGQP